jgi:hypothetical protein
MKHAVLLLLFFLGAAAPSSIRPVKWTVVGGDTARHVTAGRTARVTIQADIAKGWHIYSISQKPGGPIPLRIRLAGAADVLVRGAIEAPKPQRLFDKNFGIETELYSGNPKFTLSVGVPGNSLTGIRKFKVEARYQACSETLCLPPKTERLDATLQIARAR